jgi:surface antigen
MTNHIKRISIVIVLISFIFSACASNDWQENQKAIIGGVGGAAAGGLIASAFDANTAGVLGGMIAGGLIGGAIGNRMDAADRREANRATYSALESAPSGKTTSWRNPDSGNSGTTTPTRTYQAQSGEYCREYEQTVTIGDETQAAYGTACRQPDGKWRVVQ